MGHIFGLKKDSSTTCFWTKDFFGSIFFGLENVWIWHFCGMKIYGPNILGTYIKLTYPPDMFLLNPNKNAMTKQKKLSFLTQAWLPNVHYIKVASELLKGSINHGS